MSSWATPLLVLPGVGLLLMSTSIRYARLHDELHHALHRHDPVAIAGLLRRARLFRDTLVALYTACALLATAGLAGRFDPWGGHLADGIGALGVLALIFGCVWLIREAVVSLDVLEQEVAPRSGDGVTGHRATPPPPAPPASPHGPDTGSLPRS